MRKLIYILLIVTLSLSKGASAQGNLNNANQNVNPPAQNNINVPDEQQAMNIDVNDNVGNEAPGNDNVQKDDNGGKKPYCKECEEIKKLKQQQMAQHTSSGVTSGGKKKNQYFKKFYAHTSKKMGRVFGKHKKNKPDYSCFNW